MAQNERYRKPQTIDELKAFCAEKNMPLEKMRFFIGVDCPEPRAFGIFEAEDGDFVVYKNKANGERAVRYKGPNEAYAVNELYEKLKAETQQRREHASRSPRPSPRSASQPSPRVRKTHKRRNILLALAAAFLLACAIAVWKVPDRGYYRYDGQSYYYDDSSWYGYDVTVNDWYLIEDVAAELADHYRDYYVSKDYDDSYGVGDFRDSAYYDYDDSDYDSYYSDSDDYDWDDNWDDDDWDSWDSDDTDWDSDW